MEYEILSTNNCQRQKKRQVALVSRSDAKALCMFNSILYALVRCKLGTYNILSDTLFIYNSKCQVCLYKLLHVCGAIYSTLCFLRRSNLCVSLF